MHYNQVCDETVLGTLAAGIMCSTDFFFNIVALRLPLSSPFVAILLPLVLNLQIDLVIVLLLFCGTVSHQIHVTLLITSFLFLY